MSGAASLITRESLNHFAELEYNGQKRVSIRVLRRQPNGHPGKVVIPATDITPGSAKERDDLCNHVTDPDDRADVQAAVDGVTDDYAMARRFEPAAAGPNDRAQGSTAKPRAAAE